MWERGEEAGRVEEKSGEEEESSLPTSILAGDTLPESPPSVVQPHPPSIRSRQPGLPPEFTGTEKISPSTIFVDYIPHFRCISGLLRSPWSDHDVPYLPRITGYSFHWSPTTPGPCRRWKLEKKPPMEHSCASPTIDFRELFRPIDSTSGQTVTSVQQLTSSARDSIQVPPLPTTAITENCLNFRRYLQSPQTLSSFSGRPALP